MLFDKVDWQQIGQAVLDTLAMLGGSLFFTVLFGLPLGTLLFLTSKNQLLEQRFAYSTLSFLLNILRSIPFIILLILLMPLTTLLMGVSLGVRGVIPPLVIGTTAFFARLVETALREVDRGATDASVARGASIPQIVFRALLPEALPGIIAAITITAVVLVDYTAMSGAIGGGGIGDLAIRYGYQRFQTEIMIITVLLLIVLVQILQASGNRLVAHFTH
ncbi:methionine ABC transporter permease [uncultured Thiothrix sp.]|uniref:methionine ABC transporter permease n=1 Tax=uncultured Thiothrix sp. TaxID=223185 RepID=UPI00260D48B0|nr:methionine ABC transporter permease [uncultured Thiothrix sp.]